jgi:type VI secretion system protein ImpK
MIAESHSASLVSRLPVPETHRLPQGFYRSKLYIASSATNPLVAAAGPLFSLLERMNVSATLPPIEDIIGNIEHEVKAFQSRLVTLEFSDELILIARYLICSTIDELLGKNYTRVLGEPPAFKAFNQSANEESDPQKRFFDIVDYIKDRTSQYLDLMELAYYCLIAGFEGEHHLKADGRQALDNLIEELYQLIQTNRVHKPIRLYKPSQHKTPPPSANHTYIRLGLSAFIAITAFYFLSQTIIEHKAKGVLQGHTVLASVERYG